MVASIITRRRHAVAHDPPVSGDFSIPRARGPQGAPRPEVSSAQALAGYLEAELDRAAAASPLALEALQSGDATRIEAATGLPVVHWIEALDERLK